LKLSPFLLLVAAFILLIAAGGAVGVAQIKASRDFAWASVGLSAASVVLTAVALLDRPRV
jgi:hypothetical protein